MTLAALKSGFFRLPVIIHYYNAFLGVGIGIGIENAGESPAIRQI